MKLKVTYLKNNEIIFTNSRSKATGKSIIIIADSFEFNKKNNIINASGNVISEDLINDILITSNELIYQINDEIIQTKNNSKAEGKNTVINADNFTYYKLTNILNAKENVKVYDKIKSFTIISNDLDYLKNEEKFISRQKSEAYDDNLNIKATKFEYDKNLKILNAHTNVVIEDKTNDAIIFSENITYFENSEKIITQGNVEAIIENKYKFKSKNPILYRNKKLLNSKYETTVYDDDDNKYNLTILII